MEVFFMGYFGLCFGFCGMLMDGKEKLLDFQGVYA